MENNNNNNTQRENVNKAKTAHVRERTTRYTLKPVLRVLLIKSGGREGRDCAGLSERNMAGGREWGGVSAACI